MPQYGAGRKGPNYFDPNKNYVGFVIMAVFKNRWYTNSNDPFR